MSLGIGSVFPFKSGIQDTSEWFMVGRRIRAGEVGEGMELSSILLTTMAVSTAHQ